METEEKEREKKIRRKNIEIKEREKRQRENKERKNKEKEYRDKRKRGKKEGKGREVGDWNRIVGAEPQESNQGRSCRPAQLCTRPLTPQQNNLLQIVL